MKHLVDRYNIFYAYQPSKIDQDIHHSAVNFVIIAVILLQAFVLFFVFLRASKCSVFYREGGVILDQLGFWFNWKKKTKAKWKMMCYLLIDRVILIKGKWYEQ